MFLCSYLPSNYFTFFFLCSQFISLFCFSEANKNVVYRNMEIENQVSVLRIIFKNVHLIIRCFPLIPKSFIFTWKDLLSTVRGFVEWCHTFFCSIFKILSGTQSAISFTKWLATPRRASEFMSRCVMFVANGCESNIKPFCVWTVSDKTSMTEIRFWFGHRSRYVTSKEVARFCLLFVVGFDVVRPPFSV